jgi:hypothetical protein
MGADASPSNGESGDVRSHEHLPLLTPTEGYTVISLINVEPPNQPAAPPVLRDDHDRSNSLPRGVSNTFVYQQPPNAPILWPLEHEQEAMLLQHYIENVALFVCCLIAQGLLDS